jgi:hypothetical protein
VPVDLKKKYGPLSAVGWGAVAAGTLGAFILYRRYEADKASSSAAASDALEGGSTIPAGESSVTSSAGTSPVWSSFEQWEQALLSEISSSTPGYSSSAALNDIQDWINGQCVSAQGYSAIGDALNNPSIGLPPGFGTSLPPLTVCNTALTSPISTAPVTTATTSTATTSPAPATTATTPAPAAPSGPGNPPNLPAAIAAAMTQAGEVLGGAPVYDSAYNEWLFFTNKGGIYNIAPNGSVGPVFNGSYEGLPAQDKGPGPTGSTNRTFNALTVNPDGTYTLTDTLGENYTFTPSTPQVA